MLLRMFLNNQRTPTRLEVKATLNLVGTISFECENDLKFKRKPINFRCVLRKESLGLIISPMSRVS